MNNSDLISRDLSVLWHPCTQMKDHEALPPIPIRQGKGVWLEDFEGKRYLDAVSSWWVNLFGHSNPHINSAINQQLENLEHVILAGFSHEPAVSLAEKLLEITPGNLSRCFYSDNGSSAVEVALKMSFHYWHNRGDKKRTRFISLSNSYHGETLGALAAGDVPLYRDTYGPMLMDVIHTPSPDNYNAEPGESTEDVAKRCSEELRALLETHQGEICAIIIEPLVQCAGYMRMYDPSYLKHLRTLCDEFDVHLIADEIAVGFGRTGTLFACEQADIAPDIMCLSKGLTGGYLPLAVTLCTDSIYQAFYDDYDTLKAFLHSHSYTGNALGCSAAIATLELFESGNVIEDNQWRSKLIADLIEPFMDHPHIGDVRQTGMIAAVEMVADKASRKPYPWQERRGLTVYRHGLQQGVLLRPLGNVTYFMPPYVINEEEIRLMIRTAFEGIDLATRE